MAKAILTKKSLVLKYQKGVDDNGNPKFSTQKFSKIRVELKNIIPKLYQNCTKISFITLFSEIYGIQLNFDK